MASSAVEGVVAREAEQGLELLTPLQQIVFVIADLDSTVAMEGLFGYYDCLAGGNAARVADALEAVGAQASADMIRLANAQFPGAAPPREQESRRRALWSLDEIAAGTIERAGERFMQYPDDLGQKLEDFILANRDQTSF